MINAIIITCFILGIIVFALAFVIVKKLSKRKCNRKCGKCDFLIIIWRDDGIIEYRCRKGYL